MPKVKISEYSATANSNTDVASINIDEGCAPSGINNAIRAVMGHLKDFQQGTNGDPFNGPHNGTVGATTPAAGAFTSLTASTTLGVTGVSTLTGGAVVEGMTVGKGAGAVSTNTAVGASALAGSNSGTGVNTAVGNSALLTNSTGYYNTAIGAKHPANYFSALESNTTGNSNIAVGTAALGSNTTGSSNTALGFAALPLNTTASNNTAVGYQAGYSNTTGFQCTYVGTQAGYTKSTGESVTAVGYQALYANTADASTAVGRLALYSNTTGVNTAVGERCMSSNTTGGNNVAIGQLALQANTTGSNNTAIGRDALNANTTASSNTALGYQAGYTNTTGADCTFIGRQAGYLSTGTRNTFIGAGTGYSTTGTYNTFVGTISAAGGACGEAVTTGTKNTILGGYNGNQGGLDIRTASNYIVLSDGDGNPRGYWTNTGVMIQSVSTTDNFAAQIKNSTATRPYGLYINFSAATPNNTTENFLNCADSTNEKCVIYSSGTVTNRTGTYNAFSDIKLKQDVVDAGSQWDDIKAVRVRKFRLKDDVAADPNSKPLIGVIAQELEETSAGLIDDCVDKEGDVTKSVKYSILYMKAVKALQEAMERIEQLEARLDAANL
jgi:hypothetical protein